MKRIKKIIGIFLGLLLVVIGVVVALNYPKLNLLTGYSAKNISSSVFIAKRSLEFTDINDNDFSPVNLADDAIDAKEKYAVASVFGLKERKAIYRDGVGCVLIDDDFDPHAPYVKPHRSHIKKNLPYPYGGFPQKDTVFSELDVPAIQKAVSKAMSGNETKKTRSLMVIYKDQIIAEEYADGYDAQSLFLGWSMTKSVLATMFGILDYQGKLNIQDKANIAEWKDDDRNQITIDHLLHMNSGLVWDEDYGTISDVTKMLFDSRDMTQAQVKKKAKYPPNTHWNYSSGTTNLLSGILRDHFSSHQEYMDFPYSALIDKIGMHSMLLETDMDGNYVGSSYSWATTRDWAKFGLLYLHEGEWNGEQLFNRKWFDYARTPAPNSDGEYGGHFWLNTQKVMPDAPMDIFSANGYQGQRIFIIPSKDMVVVRFGLRDERFFDFNTLLKEVTDAVH